MHIDHFLTRDTILDGETFKYKIKITSRMPPAATKKQVKCKNPITLNKFSNQNDSTIYKIYKM